MWDLWHLNLIHNTSEEQVTITFWPVKAALWRGVSPMLFCKLASAPAYKWISKSNITVCTNRTERGRGWERAHLLTLRSSSTTSLCPKFDARWRAAHPQLALVLATMAETHDIFWVCMCVCVKEAWQTAFCLHLQLMSRGSPWSSLDWRSRWTWDKSPSLAWRRSCSSGVPASIQTWQWMSYNLSALSCKFYYCIGVFSLLQL